MRSKGNGRALLLALAVAAVAVPAGAAEAAPASGSAPTVEEAQTFMDAAEARLRDLSIEAGRAAWVQSNFITYDTQVLAAAANDRLIAATTELAQQAHRFEGLQLPPGSTAR